MTIASESTTKFDGRSPERSVSSDHETLAPFVLHSLCAASVSKAPFSVSVPFAKGALTSKDGLRLRDPLGVSVPAQSEILARWSDDSIQWVLLDAIAPTLSPGASQWSLESVPESIDAPTSQCEPTENPSLSVEIRGDDQIDVLRNGVRVARLRWPLTLPGGRQATPRISRSFQENQGLIKSSFVVEGSFPDGDGLKFHLRIHAYAGTSFLQVQARLHNPRRARHRGGLWDLGDPNSVLFNSFALAVIPERPAESPGVELQWTSGPEHRAHCLTSGFVRIEQHASGGPSWNSTNHKNASGELPWSRNGYVSTSPLGEETGLRASPVVSLTTGTSELAVSVPEFWQQFPKTLAADAHGIVAGLFPALHTPHELLPGEQKTHVVWIAAGPRGVDTGLAWSQTPPRAVCLPAVYQKAGAPSLATPAAEDPQPSLADFLQGSLSGELNLAARRDRIDEYGWRNFGDVPADHEQEHYPGREPVISHYNNQFDMIYGGILQLARTGDPRWYDLFDPLARHVIDIDIYHTAEDRAAYNGGLFWHTDHYKTAGLAAHRTYSRLNARPGAAYGGGPSNEHNYTTGLLHYYFLTGNRDARDAVLSLADWVIAMDDGRQSVLGLVDEGPTGLATATADANYHGPGRGAGNSLNALTDAWTLTRDDRYARAAEAIVRRVIHPEDDIASLDLLDSELRWSYSVFLVALSKWLDVRAEAGRIDDVYAYGQQSLLHYARWMATHERPALDHPEKLEYPTATWAAQELRKANALRLAARHADEPERSAFLRRGNELANRAWSDLEWFDNRFVARCLSILMTEGAREAALESPTATLAPKAIAPSSWPDRSNFVPQKQRVKSALRSPVRAVRMMRRLLNPFSWPRTVRHVLSHR